MPVNVHCPPLVLVTPATPDERVLGSSSVSRNGNSSGGGGGDGDRRDGGDRLGWSGGRGGDESSSCGCGGADDVVVGGGLFIVGVDDRSVHQIRTLHHSGDLDARLLRHIAPPLALVRGTGELLRIARVGKRLALLLFPDLAALDTGGRGRVEALLALGPAVVRRSPASVFVGVVGDLEAAPVGVLEEAVVGDGAREVGGRGQGGLCVGAGRGRGRAEGHGAGDLVGKKTLHVVHVEVETLVGRVDVAGDGGFLVLGDGERAGRGALDVDLGAVDVELRLAVPVAVGLGGDVLHGDNFGAQQVGARGHARGQADAEETVGVDDLLHRPLLGGLVVPVVPDLEPAGAAGALVKVRDGLGVDGNGTLVRRIDELGPAAVDVGAEFKGHLGASGGGDGVVDLLETVSACLMCECL